MADVKINNELNDDSYQDNELMDRLDRMDKDPMHGVLSDSDNKSLCRTLLDCREAKLRKETAAPDLGKEWESFRSLNIDLPKKKKQVRRLMWTAIPTGIAAMIAIALVIWHPNLTSQLNSSPTIMAFYANKAPKEVMITASSGNAAVTPVGNTGAVISKQIADFSKYAGDKVEVRTITTPRGKTYKVILNDGTIVMMNADSRLTFPTRFGDGERKVVLTGEAYFKVSKDKQHPFVVTTRNVNTRVLGTEFNLKAYATSEVHVTLITGSVIVKDNMSKKSVQLKPGQDAVLRGHEFDVTTIDTDYYTQWKDGYFYFDNLPLVEVMKELGRWYNVNIEITSNSLLSYRLHFIADRNASINEVVRNLNGYSFLSVVQTGNKIVISEK
jgi:transmembrane sensor